MLQFNIDKFSPGKLVMTRGVNDRVADEEDFAKFVLQSIRRHLKCDWGDMEESDKKLNDQALDPETQDRIFSGYWFKGNPKDKIWIIS